MPTWCGSIEWSFKMWEKIAVCIVWRRWHGKPGVCAWCDDYSHDSIVCELWHLHNRVCGDEATAIDVQWMCSNSNSSLFILVANNYWTVVHRHPLREEEQLAPCPDHLFHTAHKPPLPTWHTRRACCRNEQTTATHRFHIGYGRSEAGDTGLIAHRYCLLAVFRQFHSQEAVSTLNFRNTDILWLVVQFCTKIDKKNKIKTTSILIYTRCEIIAFISGILEELSTRLLIFFIWLRCELHGGKVLHNENHFSLNQNK